MDSACARCDYQRPAAPRASDALPEPWTEDHSNAQTWIRDNIGLSAAMGPMVYKLWELLVAIRDQERSRLLAAAPRVDNPTSKEWAGEGWLCHACLSRNPREKEWCPRCTKRRAPFDRTIDLRGAPEQRTDYPSAASEVIKLIDARIDQLNASQRDPDQDAPTLREIAREMGKLADEIGERWPGSDPCSANPEGK